MGVVAEWSAVNAEGDWCVRNSIVEDSTIPIGLIMHLVICEEWLLVAAEVCPCNVVNRGIGANFYRYRFGLRTVVIEHFCDFRVDIVSRVRTYNEIFWQEELSDYESSSRIGQNINGLEGKGAISSPFDRNLNRQVWSWLEDACIRVEPVHRTTENGWIYSIEPEDVSAREIDSRRHLVILIKDSVVIAIPI